MHRRRIADLHLVDPLGHGVVIELLDLMVVHNGFDHQVGPVSVDLGGGKVNETESPLFLKPYDVLSSDHVRQPQLFVEILAVPPSEFGSAVVDIVERSQCLEDPLELTVATDVAARVRRCWVVSLDRESRFVWCVTEIRCGDLIASRPELAG